MNNKAKNPRIANNPSAKEISDVMPVVKLAKSISGLAQKLGIKNEKMDKIHQTASDLIEQSNILNLPDRFNDAFSESGWIATGSMSVDTMRKALEFHDAGKEQEAENEIISWFKEDTINQFAIVRAKRFNKAKLRWDQLREALELTIEERYLSAVPLILIACDGFASDVMGTSPFEKDADLTAFDSITGHPNSLPFLIGLVTKGIRKSSDEDLTLPLRHGILHGRSLGYANRIVCMKAWLLMIALVDWACDKSSEEERILKEEEKANFSFRDMITSRVKLEADKREIQAFEPQENYGPFDESLDANSADYAFVDFLTSWKERNFGNMAKRAVNIPQTPLNNLAGQMRRDAEFIDLTEFEIHSVRQSTVARADAIVFMKGKTLKTEVAGKFRIIAFRHNEVGDVAMPSEKGRWHVQQNCIFDLMHEKTIEAQRVRAEADLNPEQL